VVILNPVSKVVILNPVSKVVIPNPVSKAVILNPVSKVVILNPVSKVVILSCDRTSSIYLSVRLKALASVICFVFDIFLYSTFCRSVRA
jgi:hypothetical protein